MVPEPYDSTCVGPRVRDVAGGQTMRRWRVVVVVALLIVGAERVAAQTGTSVTVETRDGDVVEGRLVSATDTEVVIRIAGQPLTLDVESLRSWRISPRASREHAAVASRQIAPVSPSKLRVECPTSRRVAPIMRSTAARFPAGRCNSGSGPRRNLITRRCASRIHWGCRAARACRVGCRI